MKYKDNLHRYRKYIADIIKQEEGDILYYYEPFCGRCHVGIVISADNKFFSDIHAPIVALFQKILMNWIPPVFIGRNIVSYAFSRPDDFAPHFNGFVGHTFTQDGSYYGHTVHYPRFKTEGQHAYRSLMRDMKQCGETTGIQFTFQVADAFEINYIDNAVIFCHPPQDNSFDYGKFWRWIETLKYNTRIYVALNSNRSVPIDYEKHWKLDTPLVYPVIYKIGRIG